MMKVQQQRQGQYGAVSLFVVIFATLLMIIITLGFIQLMIKDQQQATASDLSQSAYDSAKSGVEDAKRLLLLDQACRNNAAPAAVNCGAVATAIDSNECNTVSSIFGSPTDTETLIQQDEGDKALQQAYTCVKITAVTDDYKSVVGVNQSGIIPLKGTGSFDKVKISWFTRDDIAAVTNDMTIGFPSSGANVELPRVGARWAANYPALLRAQLMQSGSSFTLADYDAEKNASTLFLYPAAIGSSTLSFSTVRRDGLQAPEVVDCETSFSTTATYACSITIDLPTPADGDTANRNAFLRLSALYNGANYKVELLNGGTIVPFDHVQPEVDSTGRANDMFRRVKNRIEFKSDFIYPEAAVDIEGDLCKSFIITNLDADYVNSPTCTP
jgi:Tfp pilus assembly protein PilX